MRIGHVRESPSKAQVWLYSIEPRRSTPLFVMLINTPLILAMFAIHGGSLPFQFFVVLWLIALAVGWPVCYALRHDKEYSQDERLDQVVPYWPHPHIPILTKKTHLLGTAAATIATGWLAFLNIRHLLQEGIERTATGYALMLSATTALSIASLWRSLTAKPSPPASNDDETEDLPTGDRSS